MSQSTTISYAVNIVIQNSIRNEVKRKQILSYHKKHLERLNILIESGGREYIREEIFKIEGLLNKVEEYLETDINEARELSMSIGAIIHNTWGLLRAAKERAEEEDRIERIKAKKEKEIYIEKRKLELLDSINQVGTPLFKSFIKEELGKLREELFNCSNLNEFENGFEVKLEKIKAKGKVAEIKWKEQTEKEQEQIVRQAVIEDIKNEIQNVCDNEDALNLNYDKDINTLIRESNDKLEDKAFNEAIRKEVVSDIIKVLKNQGFVVGTPKLINDKVVFLGKKPSGKFASFKIDLDGKFSYKFDKYEGSSCKKDIGNFKEKLEEIYGVKMFDKEVIWENPDKISKGAIDIKDSLKK